MHIPSLNRRLMLPRRAIQLAPIYLHQHSLPHLPRLVPRPIPLRTHPGSSKPMPRRNINLLHKRCALCWVAYLNSSVLSATFTATHLPTFPILIRTRRPLSPPAVTPPSAAT